MKALAPHALTPLHRTLVRLSRRGDGGAPVFDHRPAYVPAGEHPFVGVIRQPTERQWSVIHLPTGMILSGLHAERLRDLVPVCLALNACPALDAPPATRAGQNIGGARWRTGEIRQAIADADTTALDPLPLRRVWNLAPSPAAAGPSRRPRQ